jgi:hypothetical protein
MLRLLVACRQVSAQVQAQSPHCLLQQPVPLPPLPVC